MEDKEFTPFTEAEIDLHDAASDGDLELVQILTEQGEDNEKRCRFGRTPLHEASQNGHLAVVQYLVEQGVEKNVTTNMKDENQTPLLAALGQGHFDVVRYLVEQGADLEKGDGFNDYMTPLMHACRVDQLDMAQLFLLEHGANRDKTTRSGFTPLHIAAYKGHLEITKLLMVYGADLNARASDRSF